MKKYLEYFQELQPHFTCLEIEKIRRDQNKEADAIAQFASPRNPMLDDPMLIEIKTRPCFDKPTEVSNIEQGSSWMTDLFLYIQHGVLPEDQNNQAKLKRKAAKFCIHDGGVALIGRHQRAAGRLFGI